MPQNADQDPTNYHGHTATPDPSASPTPEEDATMEKKEIFKQRPTVKDLGTVPDTRFNSKGKAGEELHGTGGQTEDSEHAYHASQLGGRIDVPAAVPSASPSPTPRGEIAQDSPIVALQKKMAAKRKAIQEQTTKPVQ